MSLCDVGRIKQLLGSHGFRFSKSMGQNFLVAPWIPVRIAGEAELSENTGVIEVGPGIGCLTEQLAPLVKKLVAVELDKSLEPLLKESLSGLDNIKIIFGDVLKTDLRGLVESELAGLRPVVCANLPYNITSPVISAFIEAGCFENMTLMVQREVALRICASAGGSDYGAFSIYANWHTEPKILFDVPPSCFMPQPKVWSSVIQLRPRKTPPYEVSDEKLFFKTVRAAFNQRRKTLVNALCPAFGGLTKEQLTKAVISCGFNEMIRGEALNIEGFVRLTNALAAYFEEG